MGGDDRDKQQFVEAFPLDVMRKHCDSHPDRPLDQATAQAAGTEYLNRRRTAPGLSVYKTAVREGLVDPNCVSPETAHAETTASAVQGPSQIEEIDMPADGDTANLEHAAEVVVTGRKATPAVVRNALGVDIVAAEILLESLERLKVVGPAGQYGERQVLMSDAGLEDLLSRIGELGDPVADYVGRDPEPHLKANPNEPIEGPGSDDPLLSWGTQPGQKMSPEQSRAYFKAWLVQRAQDGHLEFGARDMKDVTTATGVSRRSWTRPRRPASSSATTQARTASSASCSWSTPKQPGP